MNNKATTFIEVLIAVAIFLSLLTGVILVGNVGNRLYLVVTNSVDVRQQVRNAMDRIVRELRESNASDVDCSNSSSCQITFWGPRYKDSNGQLCPIRYFLSEGKIMREFPPDVEKTITTDVTRLQFVKTGGLVDVGIEAVRTIRGVPLTFVLQQKVRARNE